MNLGHKNLRSVLLFAFIVLCTVCSVHGQKKVAILGGGMASLSTAYHLVKNQGSNVDITVYQMGWRLGGKTHTGRNTTPGFGNRVEEHGVHLLFGWNADTFHMMDDVYTSLNRPSSHPIPNLTAALMNQTEVTLANCISENPLPQNVACEDIGGFFEGLEIPFPRGPLIHAPGDPLPDPWYVPGTDYCEDPLSAVFNLINIIYLTKKNVVKALNESGVKSPCLLKNTPPLLKKQDGFSKSWQEDMQEDISCLLKISNLGLNPEKLLIVSAQFFLATARGIFKTLEENNYNFTSTWNALESVDFYDFLVKYGYPDDDDHSTYVLLRMVYYSNFNGFPGGIRKKGQIAAGTAYQNLCTNILDYKGAWSYYMRAGTGETLIVPLYQYLKNNGVKFQFFHKVTDIRPNVNGTDIDSIDFEVQAQLKNPSVPYSPLINVQTEKGILEAWPKQPLYDQLVGGDTLKQYNFESSWSPKYPSTRKTIKVGQDFDIVVNAIAIAALNQTVAPSLKKASKAWNDMVYHISNGTTPTYGVQIWFTQTPQDMGAKLPLALNKEPEEWKMLVMSPLLDGAADYSHIVPYESQPTAKSVVYFSSSWEPLPGDHPYSNTSYPAAENQHLMEVTDDWLRKYMQSCCYHSIGVNNTFRYDWILDPKNATGRDRLRSQYFTANVEPTDFYTIALPGGNLYRMKPDGTPFRNMFIAGDWTNTGFAIGTIETAVRSGKIAAAGISYSMERGGRDKMFEQLMVIGLCLFFGLLLINLWLKSPLISALTWILLLVVPVVFVVWRWYDSYDDWAQFLFGYILAVFVVLSGVIFAITGWKHIFTLSAILIALAALAWKLYLDGVFNKMLFFGWGFSVGGLVLAFIRLWRGSLQFLLGY